jgi:hypothetical protein
MTPEELLADIGKNCENVDNINSEYVDKIARVFGEMQPEGWRVFLKIFDASWKNETHDRKFAFNRFNAALAAKPEFCESLMRFHKYKEEQAAVETTRP